METKKVTKAKVKPAAAAKKAVPKKGGSSCPAAVGGGMVDDIRSLAVPFALTLLTKTIKKKQDGAKEAPSKKPAATATSSKKTAPATTPAKKAAVRAAVGGGSAKPNMMEIKREFTNITQQIHDFLKKY